MKLFRVREGKFLHWPPEIEKKDKLWLAPGGVLDLEDPFIAKCVKGQEYKLEEAPADVKTPTKVAHSRFMRMRELYEQEIAEKQAAVVAVQAPATPEAAKDIPKPDPRPTKVPKKE